MASELTKMGAHIEERPDGLIIRGVPMLHGAGADSWNDHRVAMSLAIAATRSDGPVILTGSESVQKSYPQFWQDYESLGGKSNEFYSRNAASYDYLWRIPRSFHWNRS